AIVIEDLHWADSATLDLLEHLLVRAGAVTLLGTWRLDDTSTREANEAWFGRVRRSAATSVVELGPLSIEECAEQVRLLTGSEPGSARVARIYGRSAGQPLFTEQLTTQPDDQELPRLLADLLDHRLGPLAGGAWHVARALGLADRGLEAGVLGHATELSHDDLTTALHELRDRRLLASTTSAEEVRLAHPLIAEAVRRRVMPGEQSSERRRLAIALAASSNPAAAEVAEHWQAAGDGLEELTWRVAAAHEAARRLGPAQEAEQWLRALELWPADGTTVGTPPVRWSHAAFRAIDALWESGQPLRADVLVTSLLPRLDELAPHDAAELLYDAAMCESNLRSMEKGLQLIERSVAIMEPLGASTAQVSTLRMNAMILEELGRLTDASAVLDRAWQINRTVGDVEQERRLMAERAWRLFEAGHRREALDLVTAATRVETPVPNPFGDVIVAEHHTSLLFESNAPTGDVLAAARPGLATASAWGIDSDNVSWLHYNVSIALARSGDVGRAAAVIDQLTEGEFVMQHHPADLARAELDLQRGRFDAVHTRVERAQEIQSFSLDVRGRWCGVQAELALWEGRHKRSLDLALSLLDLLVDTDLVVWAATYFVLAARAAAGVAETGPADLEERRHLTMRLEELRARADRDPLAHDPGHAATWAAELSRLQGQDAVEPWLRAAAEWDTLSRPHDAAYCRWRAAQVAVAQGKATVAGKLLRRAALDARQHVPLAAAIAKPSSHGVAGPRS
ncbi:MAG TPA: hypothetical protein VFI19_16920, partial [Nocardioides sp.]|nr:hypothetical protein [Nocardioides sp.]